MSAESQGLGEQEGQDGLDAGKPAWGLEGLG